MRISDWSSDVCSSDLLSVLGELDAEIVALQEADRRFGTRASAIPPRMFAEHSDYVPVDLLEGRPYAIGWHGNALLVRKDAEVEESHVLHLPTLEPRGAVAATVRVGGTRLRVVGMHPTFRDCAAASRSEEHTSELQSLMRISYAVFCLKKTQKRNTT